MSDVAEGLNRSPSVVTGVKSRRLTILWAHHIVRMEKIRNADNFWSETSHIIVTWKNKEDVRG
jgi:hypothetical protein